MDARVAALLVLAACGDNLVDRFPGLVAVSGATPFAKGCNGGQQSGTNFPSAEVEPWLAIDPGDETHLVATWQQDRWSNGGANGNLTATSHDGGSTWDVGEPAFGHCSGGDYERTSDPWVTITPDGAAYASAITFDASTARSGVMVSRSADGMTWEPPVAVIADDDPDVFNDKDSIASDALHVYALWDRLTGETQPTKPIGTGAAYMARLTAGTWEPARAIFDPGVDSQTLGNVLAVLPDGTLVVATDVFMAISSQSPTGVVAVVRSTDHGDTWSAPITIAPLDGIGVVDPKGVGVRSGTDLIQIAVDRHSGALYVTWEALAGDHDGVVLSRSGDGGLTWSAPAQINGAPDIPAFEPTVAVADNGALGVIYYDLRGATPSSFAVTAWLAISVDGGATWTEGPLTAPFALAPALLGDSYFLGDYQGLATAGDAFVPLFVAAVSPQDPTDGFVRPLP